MPATRRRNKTHLAIGQRGTSFAGVMEIEWKRPIRSQARRLGRAIADENGDDASPIACAKRMPLTLTSVVIFSCHSSRRYREALLGSG